MPALSIIPFILYLMDPLPLNFQQLEGFAESKYIASPLTMETDIKTSNNYLASSTLTFTKNLGGPGKLPVPLFAELDRTMSNRARIYQQYKEDSTHLIKRAYLYSETCSGQVALTEDFDTATLFQIRNENDQIDDKLFEGNFFISCSAAQDDEQTTVAKKLVAIANDDVNKKTSYQIAIIEDSNVEHVLLTGMMTPFFVQNKFL